MWQQIFLLITEVFKTIEDVYSKQSYLQDLCREIHKPGEYILFLGLFNMHNLYQVINTVSNASFVAIENYSCVEIISMLSLFSASAALFVLFL